MHATTMLSDAEKCRANGWGVGTRLIGDEGYGPTVIEITAIGETHILARAISYNGKAANRGESHWTLSARDWEKVADAPHAGDTLAGTGALAGRVHEWLRGGGTSPAWVWWAFKLWECPCGERSRNRNVHTTHQLTCRTARAYDGQG